VTAKYRDVVHYVAKLRDQQGLTQRHVADRLFVHPSAVSRFEVAHHSPQLQTFLDYLGAAGLVMSIRIDEEATRMAEVADAARLESVVRQEEPK
jgi:transcriptional regulator with XRE-family HTH domain